MCGDVQSEEPVKLRQKEAELIDVIDVACGRLQTRTKTESCVHANGPGKRKWANFQSHGDKVCG